MTYNMHQDSKLSFEKFLDTVFSEIQKK